MANLTLAVTNVFDWMTDALTFMLSEPVLLLPVAIFCVYAGVNMIKRILS